MMAIIDRSSPFRMALSAWRDWSLYTAFLIGQLVPVPGDSFTFESIRKIPLSVHEIE